MSNSLLSFSKDSLSEAIELAAKENFERDSAVIGLGDTGPWNEVKELYLEEAEYLLRKTGKNWEPELPHHHYITIKD